MLPEGRNNIVVDTLDHLSQAGSEGIMYALVLFVMLVVDDKHVTMIHMSPEAQQSAA